MNPLLLSVNLTLKKKKNDKITLPNNKLVISLLKRYIQILRIKNTWTMLSNI